MGEKNKKKKNRRVKAFFTDFKAFIARGNVLDLAIAVIIGGAFGKIVSSLVNDVIMPLITMLAGGKSVKDWKVIITHAEIKDGVEVTAENAIRYGMFLQTVLDFLIIALFIFLALRIVMRIKKLALAKEQALEQVTEERKAAENEKTTESSQPETVLVQPSAVIAEDAPLDKPSAEQLLAEIRDLLKDNKNK